MIQINLPPSKTQLVYDIQELFRWIIDLAVIELLQEKKLRKSDFMATENYHIRLTEKAAKMLIERILVNFNRKAAYKNGKNFTYQNILLDNVQQLSNFILDKTKTISIRIPNVHMTREDSLDAKEKILVMTPEERIKFGINKSTLWYQKQNLAAGKRTKLYSKVLSKLDR